MLRVSLTWNGREVLSLAAGQADAIDPADIPAGAYVYWESSMNDRPDRITFTDCDNDRVHFKVAGRNQDSEGSPAIYVDTSHEGAYITEDQIPALVARLSAYYCYLTGEEGVPFTPETDRANVLSAAERVSAASAGLNARLGRTDGTTLEQRVTGLEHRVSHETAERLELERRAKISVEDLRERIVELEEFRDRLNSALNHRD